MKKILLINILLTVFICNAQNIQLNYVKKNYSFIWLISNIEYRQNETLLYIKVRNTANDTRYINTMMGAVIYSDKYPKGIRATRKIYEHSSKNIPLLHNEVISFVLSFPSSQICNGNEFNLHLGEYYKFKGISIPPELSLSDVNKQMLTWAQFYNQHRKVQLTYKSVDEVKTAIKKEVENWQRKGEFESTESWQIRVNNQSRQHYINKVKSELSAKYEADLSEMKKEQEQIARNYENYKRNILSEYYKYKISLASNKLYSSYFELHPYDADHQTFLIHSDLYGDILLPVPIEYAPSFKNNWYHICSNIKPVFVPNGEDVALSKLIFSNHGTDYIFDSHTDAIYAIMDINYNFAPLEIEEFDINEISFDEVTKASSSLVAINNSHDALSKNSLSPVIKRISASDKSDIDSDIPRNQELKNSTTFAIIIANEKYDNVSDVNYAENDGNILSKYFISAIGIPKDNVKKYINATYGQISGAIQYIKDLSNAFGDKLNLIIYYAGHGVPNEKTKQCMLLPTDGDAKIPATLFDLNKLYSEIGNLNVNSIIIFMDACFSGSLRGEGTLYTSRAVKIKSMNAEPKGKMVILSASQGDETAFPWDREQHGLFTYYLLKCLQENNGNITLGKLSEYIIENVKKQSIITNGKIQTPLVQYSTEIKDSWRSWKLAQ